MATSIAVVGKSGTGKSTSIGSIPSLGIKGLEPKETVIINTVGKPLPFKGWKKKYVTTKGKDDGTWNYVHTKSPSSINKVIKHVNEERPEIKNLVIEDGQYIMAFDFMSKARTEGYGKFAEIGINLSSILNTVTNCREDLNVIFLWHPEQNSLGEYKMKSVGKMVDEYITLEGLFSVVLYSDVSTSEGVQDYKFITNNNGVFPAKSPVGMFSELEIKNDLGLVVESIIKYNE